MILHGLFGSLDNWMSLAKVWSESYTIYLIDQRNHGRSQHDDVWDYETMAEDLLETMDALGIYQASILGHSMGGKTAFMFAHLYPDRLDKLIVVDMGIKAYAPHHEDIIASLNRVDLSGETSRQAVDQALSQGIKELGTRQFLMKSLARVEGKRFAWRFNLPVIAAHYQVILQAIPFDMPYEGPTLLVYGGKSNYVVAQDLPVLQEQFPNGRFVAISEAGHWVHAEAPQALSLQVMDFMNESF